MALNEGGNGFVECYDAAMNAAPYFLIGEDYEEALDLVEPGGTGLRYDEFQTRDTRIK